jgi:hypothetical protein
LADEASLPPEDTQEVLAVIGYCKPFYDLRYDYEEVLAQEWTAGKVRGFLAEYASQHGLDLEDLIEQVIETTKELLAKYREQSEAISEEMRRMSRERLLPSVRTIDQITRYEAHLHRQLLQTMHELEAMQDRRLGAAAPLARLDVTQAP